MFMAWRLVFLLQHGQLKRWVHLYSAGPRQIISKFLQVFENIYL